MVIADAKTINRKIQGAKANSTTKAPTIPTYPNAPAPTDKTISTLQQCYYSLIDHFTKLMETILQKANYKPNETDLQTATLQTRLLNMKATNTELINNYTSWSNTRIKRNGILNNALSGLVPTALEEKKYVKSVFGVTSPQYKQVSRLEFNIIKTQ